MKLTPDNAYFIRWGERSFPHVATVAEASGVVFECPAHPDDRHAHSVCVWFAAHPGGAPVAPPDVTPKPRWGVSGTTLADLTITPSINLGVTTEGCAECGHDTNPCPHHPQAGRKQWPPSCRWHGFVTNGEAK